MHGDHYNLSKHYLMICHYGGEGPHETFMPGYLPRPIKRDPSLALQDAPLDECVFLEL